LREANERSNPIGANLQLNLFTEHVEEVISLVSKFCTTLLGSRQMEKILEEADEDTDASNT
jgi:hypothetical protein